jgi:hypothetical protein
MEIGHYWIKQGNLFIMSFWNGEAWDNTLVTSSALEIVSERIKPPCPTGCKCTQNSDGSWTVNCTGQ